MGYINRPPAPYNGKPIDSHSFMKGKLSLIKVSKSNLVRVTTEEFHSLRPSVYKYLLP